MHRKVSWALSVPPGPVLGVVYALHGRGANHRFAFDEVQLDRVAASLDLPLVIASVDGGDHSYWHRRADGTDASLLLTDEFIPHVEELVGRQQRALLGWSMGGYGALLAAERHPADFRVIAAASAALWRSYSQTAPGAFDSSADYDRNDVFSGVRRLDKVPIRVDCGTSDPFYSADRHFTSLLTGPHSSSFGSGGHNPSYWRSVAPAQLRTIAKSFRSAVRR
jgi:S-formylglutathione hydrolase FrmB